MSRKPDGSNPLLETFYEAHKRLPAGPMAARQAEKNMRAAIGNLARFLGRRPRILDLSGPVLNRLFVDLGERGFKVESLNSTARCFRRAASLACEAGLLATAPMIVLPSRPRRTSTTGFTVVEIERLLAAGAAADGFVSGTPAQAWWPAALRTTLNASLGVETLLSLQRRQWRQATGRLSVGGILFQLLPATQQALLDLHGAEPDSESNQPLFPWSLDPRGYPWPSFYLHFGQLLTVAGMSATGAVFDKLRTTVERTDGRAPLRELDEERVAQMAAEFNRARQARQSEVQLRHVELVANDQVARGGVAAPYRSPRHLRHIVSIDNPSPRTLRRFYFAQFEPLRLIDVANATRQSYVTTLNNLTAYYGTDPTLDVLNEESVGHFLAWFVKRHSPATANRQRANILCMCRYARRRKLIDAVFDDCPKLKEKKRIPRAWTMDEFARILKAGAETPGMVLDVPARFVWPALLLMLFDTGLRISALVRSPRENLDLEKGILFVPAELQKHGADQYFDLSEQTLIAFRATRPDARTMLYEFPYQLPALQDAYRSILLRAGLPSGPRDLFHKIRRTCASHLAHVAGQQSATDLLGHSGAAVTKRYLDPDIVGRVQAGKLLPRPTFIRPAEGAAEVEMQVGVVGAAERTS